MNLFHPFTDSLFIVSNSLLCGVAVWATLRKRKGVPSQSSLNSDYNQKLTRIAWVIGLGSFPLPILLIYLSTIVPSNQVLLFGLVPGIVIGISYFPITHKRAPSQSSSNSDYNKKLARIAWIIGSGSFLLPILAIYLSTIVLSNQEQEGLFNVFMPATVLGAFYFPLMYKANHYEQDENKKSKQIGGNEKSESF